MEQFIRSNPETICKVFEHCKCECFIEYTTHLPFHEDVTKEMLEKFKFKSGHEALLWDIA